VTEPQKPNDAKTLNEQFDALEKQAQKTEEEIQKLVEKRDRLNEQCRQLREEIRTIKAERDSINEKVHTLKAQRDEARTAIQPVVEEIRAAREKIAELKKKVPKRSQFDLQKEFDDIEWKIQTTSLDLKEERLLIENVKQLEMQLSAYKKIDQQKKRIQELQQGLKAVDENGDKLHTELSALAQQSQELHQKMITKIEEAGKIKEEADTSHNNCLLAREKARQLDEERRKLEYEERKIRTNERQLRAQERQVWETQRRVEEATRQQDEATRKTERKELKEKLGIKAREKLQRGEKLSWDEFQLLADEDESESQD
jgi:uncharacterized coiled-coil DUF342 family protein